MSYREAYYFESLGEMMATSVSVIVGTVLDVEAGRTLTYEGNDTLSYTNVSLDHVEQLARESTPSSVTIELDELYTGYSGTPRPKWIEPGQDVLIFLTAAPGLDGVYQPVNSQAVYRIEADTGLVAAAPEGSSLSREIAGMTLDEARAEIVGLRERVEAGEFQPLPAGPPGVE